MDPFLQKPLFITTVPQGVFLEPLNCTDAVNRKVYHYSSHPRVLRSTNPKDFELIAKISSCTAKKATPAYFENKSQRGTR